MAGKEIKIPVIYKRNDFLKISFYFNNDYYNLARYINDTCDSINCVMTKRILKKIFSLLLSIVFILACPANGQKKRLSIEQAALGARDELKPEDIEQLQWRSNTNYFTFVENENLMQQNAVLSRAYPLLTLIQLNEMMGLNGAPTMQKFPKIRWLDYNIFAFHSETVYARVNVSRKKVVAMVRFPKGAKNIDVCSATGNVAYTIGNNLFIATPSNLSIQVTDNQQKGIVSGQEVHRGEFGIDKGTFWSPDGKFLAFYHKDETMVTEYPLVKTGARIANHYPVRYPMAGMTSHEIKIGIYPIDSARYYFLQTGMPTDRYFTNLSWAPDSKSLLVAEVNRDQNHMKLNSYDVLSGQMLVTLFEESNEKYVEPLHPARFLETRPHQFLWISRRSGYYHVYLYHENGSLLKQITDGPWSITKVEGFDKEEENFFFTATEQSPVERHFYRVNIHTGEMKRFTSEAGTHEVLMNSASTFYIDKYSNIDTPNKIIVLDVEGKPVKNLLTAKNPLEGYGVGDIEISNITAENGEKLYYRMVKPVGFTPNGNYPAIVYVYGGPHVQLVKNEWLGGASLWDFYMSQGGYVIFSLDNRGAANRGMEFESQTFRRLGEIERQDQLTGIKFLADQGFVNMNRVGVYGWSYGGYMTTNLMLNNPGEFSVGVAGAPVIDWKLYEVMYTERYMDTPADNPDGYEKTNLLNHVDGLDGRLLMVHGAQDSTVVWQHSLRFIEKCIDKGKLVDYFVYPDHDHGIGGRDRIHLLKKITQYFEDYL